MTQLTPNRTLIAQLCDELAKRADPVRAAQQQAYMKSEVPYFGVGSPEVKQIVAEVRRTWRPDRDEWLATISELWDDSTHREERYLAIELAKLRFAAAWQMPDLLPTYRHWVISGAWWDYVDAIAAHLVGAVLMQNRAEVTPLLRDWAVDSDLWVRRTAILAQLRHKAGTDPELLEQTIEPNLADQSFWIRKAIGWALRQYARVDPAWVMALVNGWEGQISGLSRREALKHIGP